ncbi:MAG TPA: AraC family transcriptional regulator [Chryseosolibacter sp.]
MTPSNQYYTVDNPNIGILCPSSAGATPFGKFFDSSRQSLEKSVEQVRTRDMYLPNFSLRSFEGRFDSDAVFYNEQGKGVDLLGSCIFFKGTVSSFLSDRKIISQSFSDSQNFKFDPNNEFLHSCKKDADINFVHISYKPSFLDQFLPEDEKWADTLRTKVHKRERILGKHFAALSLAQKQAVRNIYDCPLDGKLGYLMIETCIIQLILVQLHFLFSADTAFEVTPVNRRDADLMKELKDYLSATFLDDHSMLSLAKHFGTNTNKLMSLFKKLSGKSIFEYLSELRMEHARQLLLDEAMLVTEVARTVGYKNPNHFSAAFKKHYGICPSEVK